MTATLDTTCFFVLYLCFTLLYFILCVVQWTRNEHARHHLVSLYFFVLYFTLLYVISCVAQWTRNEHAMNTLDATWFLCIFLYLHLIFLCFVVSYLYLVCCIVFVFSSFVFILFATSDPTGLLTLSPPPRFRTFCLSCTAPSLSSL